MYRLVIADDEESIRNGMAHSLPWEELGFTVVGQCENGQEVIDRLEELKPDVVLSDIRMPVMDGVELMKYLNREHPEIRIVILSGYSDFEYLNESIKNHVAEYLLKPTDIDEFEETFRHLKESLDKERQQQDQINESVEQHFRFWLLSLLHGSASERDDERFMPILSKRGIDPDNLVVVFFTPDGHDDDRSAQKAALMEKIMAAAGTAPVGEGLSRLLLNESDQRIIALFSSQNEIQEEEVTDAVRAVQDAVKGALSESLTAGISSLCTERDMLAQEYEQASCCAKQGAFMGGGSIVNFRDLGSGSPKDLPYFNLELIEKALLKQDSDSIRREVDRVFKEYENPAVSYQYPNQLCLSLLFHISLWGLRYGVLMENVLGKMGAAYTDIYTCSTLEKKKEFVMSVLGNYQKAVGEQRAKGMPGNSVALRVRGYVDKEYCSNSISLESVAEHVHKAPAYISRLFKNEFGCNFSEYLTKKRMKLAAQLLNDPDALVYNVAHQCGYVDASNFIRVFKRYYGISPAEYRVSGRSET